MSKVRSERLGHAIDMLVRSFDKLPEPQSDDEIEAEWQRSMRVIESYQASVSDPESTQLCPSAQEIALSVLVLLVNARAFQERDIEVLAKISDPSSGTDMIAIIPTISALVCRAVGARESERAQQTKGSVPIPLDEVPF